MPSRYKRRPGSRRYVDYSNDKLAECLKMIRTKQLTQRQAEKEYNIPRSTIKNKLKGFYPGKPGGRTIFTEEEEEAFVAHIMALSEYGFPLTEMDLKFVIKDYLTAQGREVKKFKNNVPGQEWLRCFFHRHKELSRRMANNIKKVRAQVSEEIINNFIENLATELQDIPPENIYNYDETNLTDDPGKKKVICRRGSKYPESIINSSKLSYSVMFCGNAAGETIPPYIIYKSEHLWTTWTENGPHAAKYNRTKSGWMDSVTFEDWFIRHLLPILKQKAGKKIVIGDNLASHINPKVLEECQRHDIGFICLPANSTHILQPLDVAYFRPLKMKWRQVLLSWKHSQIGRRLSTTPKDQFPALLKKALDSLIATRENVIAGFRKSGIMPTNKDEPLSRLPKQDRVVNLHLITGTFMQQLELARSDDSSVNKLSKKKKLSVPAGRSISASDIGAASSSVLTQNPLTKPKKTKKTKRGVAKAKTQQRRRRLSHVSTTSCSSYNMSDVSSTQDLPDDDFQFEDEQQDGMVTSDSRQSPQQTLADHHTEANIQGTQESDNDVPLASISKKPLINLKDVITTDDHVLVRWGTHIYPGKVLSTCDEGLMVEVMKKGAKFWRWPAIRDEQLYRWEDLIQKINVPTFQKKGCFSVPEID